MIKTILEYDDGGKKTRLDVAVFERGLTDSRAKAGALIMAGQVFVNGQKALKSGQNVKEDDQIEVRGEKCRLSAAEAISLTRRLRHLIFHFKIKYVWI